MKKIEIKYLFFVPLIYLSFLLFHKFLFVNIMTLDIGNKGGQGAAGLPLLLLSIIIAILIICYFFRCIRMDVYKKSFLYLFVYFCYFALRILIDTQNTQTLKTYTIATTGGIILYYGLGVLFGLLIFLLHNIQFDFRISIKYRAVLFFVYLMINLFSIMGCFSSVSSIVRVDILGLEGGANYQRIGNFLIMNTVLLSLLYFNNFIYLMHIRFLFKKLYLIFIFFAYFVYSVLIIVFSQLVGSNNGFVTCCGVLFLSVSLHIFIFILQKTKFVLLYRIKLRSFFRGGAFSKFLKSILISLLFLLFSIVAVVLKLGIDISKMRIFGYGESSTGLGSLTSRFELLSNFYTHFSVSPFWGCVNADVITTGDGTYVHSFILSMLTHMGILGFGVFVVFFIQAMFEYFYKDFNLYDAYKAVYEIFLLLGVGTIAIIAVFFTWVPIWFLFGLLFKPLKIVKLPLRW